MRLAKSYCGFLLLICSVSVLILPSLGESQQRTQSQKRTQPQQRTKESVRLEQLNTDLLYAASKGYEDSVSNIILQGADVNTRDPDGMTPLARAAVMGNKGVVDILLQEGADPNIMDVYGATALMQACWAGNMDIVKALLAKGADPNLKGQELLPSLKKKGVTALWLQRLAAMRRSPATSSPKGLCSISRMTKARPR